MSKKERAIVTNIEDYIRGKYSEVAELFEYCKVLNTINPRAGSAGVTLLIPDAEYIKHIDGLSRSSSAGDIETVCDTLLSLVIRKCMTKPSDWEADDISDARFPAQRITATASGDKVSLKGPDGKVYATATMDKNFKVGYRSNVSVWKLEGRMRTEKDADAPRKKPSRSRAPPAATAHARVRGGYDLTPSHSNTVRFQIAIAAENELVAQLLTGKKSDPFMSYVSSFARFMYTQHTAEFFQCVLPMIRYRITDFYTIFEPHRLDEQDRYLVHRDHIDEWWATHKHVEEIPESVIAFRAWVDERLREASSHVKCGIYEHLADDQLHLEIDRERLALSDALENAQAAPKAVREFYDRFIASNAIGSIQNVLPEGLITYYRAHPGFKLMHDELAFVIEPIIIGIRARAFDMARFREVINMIGNIMHASSIDELERNLPLSSTRKQHLTQGILIGELRAFVNSTIFLWVPLTTEKIEKYSIECESRRVLDASNAIFNADLALALHHKRLYGESAPAPSDASALALLSKLEPAHVSAELRARMQVLLS